MSKKASENVRYYKNPNGPCISTVSRRVIEKDGLYFKDLDGSGEFRPYDDWRLSPEKRAAAYVKVLSVDEKIAQLFISDWRMGKYPAAGHMSTDTTETILDESGLLDETEIHGKNIFGEQHLPVQLQGDEEMCQGHVHALVDEHGGHQVSEHLLHLGAPLPPQGAGGGGGQVVGELYGASPLSGEAALQQLEQRLVVHPAQHPL